jgi:hypothetical protein
MIIDLKRTVIKIQLRRFITLFVFMIFIILVIFLLDVKQSYFGLSKYQWAIVISGLYVAFVIYQAILELNYIYFNDQGDRIILRYFSMSFYNSKKQSIEIPIESFSGYEIRTSFAGLKQKLVLYERIKNTDAKYPAVSLSALSKNQKENLFAALERNKISQN